MCTWHDQTHGHIVFVKIAEDQEVHDGFRDCEQKEWPDYHQLALLPNLVVYRHLWKTTLPLNLVLLKRRGFPIANAD